jgi:hypothetical protein
MGVGPLGTVKEALRATARTKGVIQHPDIPRS